MGDFKKGKVPEKYLSFLVFETVLYHFCIIISLLCFCRGILHPIMPHRYCTPRWKWIVYEFFLANFAPQNPKSGREWAFFGHFVGLKKIPVFCAGHRGKNSTTWPQGEGGSSRICPRQVSHCEPSSRSLGGSLEGGRRKSWLRADESTRGNTEGRCGAGRAQATPFRALRREGAVEGGTLPHFAG